MCEPGKPCPGAEEAGSLPEALAKLFTDATTDSDKLELAQAIMYSNMDDMMAFMKRIHKEHPDTLEWPEGNVLKTDFITTTLYRLMARGMGITMLSIKLGKDGKLDLGSVEATEIVKERENAASN
jgi:hypothetical protein